MRARRPSRSSPGLLVVFLLAQLWGACASVPPPGPMPPEVEAARALLEERWRRFADLRTLAEITIRQGERVQRLTGVLLLRAPSALRFEALSPFGPPILLVAATSDTVTVWEVVKNRAYVLPASADANRRWLGLALGPDDLVAVLAGHARPLKAPRTGQLLPPDEAGPSLRLDGPEGSQRIWLDPATGQSRQIEWREGKNPFRAVFAGGGPGEPPAEVLVTTLDGKLELTARYRKSQLNTGFDPDLLTLTVPQGVEIQDFR